MVSHKGDKAYSAYRILQVVFILAPIIAGLDKFFHFLVNWHAYLAPHVGPYIEGRYNLFMMGVGVIEIIAGLGVLFKPKIFAYIVSLWLLFIIINLLLLGKYYDVALRDFGLMLSAFALGQLALIYDRK